MKFSEGTLKPLGKNSNTIVKALCGAHILNIGFHENIKGFVIDYFKDNQLQRIAFTVGLDTKDLIFGGHVIRKNTDILNEVEKKLIEFSEGDWRDDFDFTQIEIIILPTERRYSFRYKEREVLSLNIKEIKQLSDHLRSYFVKKIDTPSELCMYLILVGNSLKEDLN